MSDDDIVGRVVTAVAAEEGVDPAELDPPLASVVDPDALADLVEADPPADTAALEVRFPYRGHTVVARPTGVSVL